MDIGLDFVLNFKIILYNFVRIYGKLIDLSMYYYVNQLSIYISRYTKSCRYTKGLVSTFGLYTPAPPPTPTPMHKF